MARPSVLLLAVGVMTLAIATTALAAADAATVPADPTSRPSTARDSNAERIADLYEYYARLYRQPVTQRDRFARLIGVVSLSRIDGPPLTRQLLMAARDEDLLVAQ